MKKKKKRQDWVFDIFNYLIIGIITILCIFPFYYVFIYSISDAKLAEQGISLLPKGFSLQSYITLFKLNDIPHAIFISVLRTLIGTVGTVLSCSFFAYLVSIPEMWFRSFIYRLCIFSMYCNAGMIPVYLVIKGLHLTNSFWVYIIPGLAVAYYIILIKTYIESLPASLRESAMLDGAGTLSVYWKIVLPLSKPIIATIALFTAVGQWNSWFDNKLYNTKAGLKTLQLVLYDYLNSSSVLQNMSNLDLAAGRASQMTTPMSLKVAITVITILPIIIVYPFMQRYFTKGIMMGAVKG